MKKRLLSAALALAMVLTLLPLSAFATVTSGDAVTYYNVGQAFSNPASGQDANATTAGWYKATQNTTTGDANYGKYTYERATTGFVANNKWYNTTSDAGFPTSGTIYPLGAATWGVTTGNYTLDLKDATSLNLSSLSFQKVSSPSTVGTSLTITDTSNPATQKAVSGDITVGADTATNGMESFSVTFTNVNATSNITYYTSGGGQVNVNNATVAKITMKGQTSAASQTTTTGGTVTLNGGHAGSISITATTGGSIKVGNSASSRNNSAGAINLINTSNTAGGGSVETWNATVAGVGLYGIGTKLNANNTGITADVAAAANTTASVGQTPLTDAQKNSATPPDIKIHGGSVTGTITQAGDQITNPLTILIDGNAHVTGALTLPNASLTVNSGHTGAVDLASGNLNVSGTDLNAASLGDLTLGSANKTVNFTVTGKNVTTGTIKKTAGTVNFTTPAEDSNIFGTITGTFDNRGVKGGTFSDPANPADPANVDSSLKYMMHSAKAGVRYYSTSDADFQKMVNRYQTEGGGTVNCWCRPIGQSTGAANKITFKDGGSTLLEMTYVLGTKVPLPKTLNGKPITKWTELDSADETKVIRDIPGYEYGTPNTPRNIVLTCQVTDNVITKLTSVRSLVDGITARLNGNVITLTGAVPNNNMGGTTVIPLEISTDGKPGLIKKTINVNYDVASKSISFDYYTTPGGLKVSADNKTLLMPDGVTGYTLNGSGMREQASKLPQSQVIGYTEDLGIEVKVTVTGPGWTTARQEDLAKTMSTGATVNFANSSAVKEALNRQVATITDSQIDSWVRTAQTAAWRNVHKTGSPTNDQLNATGYNKVYVVAYLAATVSTYSTPTNSNNGVLTMALVPSYRVEVRGGEGGTYKLPANNTSGYTTTSDSYYVAKAGSSMGTLDGEAGTIPVKLTAEGGFTTTNGWAHQNSIYAYALKNDAGKISFDITHTVSNSLGTIVINGVPAPVTLYKSKADKTVLGTYDTLQAAVDDTEEGNFIDVAGDYTGSTNISVTGTARKFIINTNGKNRVTSNVEGIVNEVVSGTEYEVQLKRDTVKPTTANITIASAVGGSARVSANPAKYGEKVTITLTASTGYTPAGVSVRDGNNQTISVTGSGSTYTFTMPSGSVTVTPTFNKVQQTNATVTVSNPSAGGTAATSAGNSQVAPGTPVSVTVSPATGYRTMGVYVTNATATRTGANTFSFTVPSGTTNVVVTPRFDRTNGTLFEDVWSYDYFSNAVAWAVGRGVTNGDGSVYRFGTGKSCTREDMVTFLWRNAGSPIVSGVSNPFWDVQVGSYYYNAVMWAVKNGITKGVSTTQFGVGRAVTRGEAVTFLYRAAGEPAASTNSGFYDVPSSEYYAKAVSWAVGKGITNGDGSTVKFSPNGYCLREQIVTFMYRNATGTRA